MGCGVDKLPSMYFNLSLGAYFKFGSVLDLIEERFHKKVGFLEAPTSFKGSEIDHVKGLADLLTPLVISKKVQLRVEKIQWDFCGEVIF